MRKLIALVAFSAFVILGVAAAAQDGIISSSPANCWLGCSAENPWSMGDRFKCVSACCGC